MRCLSNDELPNIIDAVSIRPNQTDRLRDHCANIWNFASEIQAFKIGYHAASLDIVRLISIG